MGLLAPLQLKDVSSKIDRNHDRSSTRTYTGFYSLDCDENYVRNNVLVGPNLPAVAITDQHPTDAQQFVTDINVSLAHPENMVFYDDGVGQLYTVNNGLPCLYWQIAIDFGLFNPLEQSPTGIMIDMPARYRWESEDENLPIFADLSDDGSGNNVGKPILNSAGDYFNPGIERVYPKKRLTVLRNESSPNWAALTSNEYCTNQAPWNGFDVNCVLLKPFRTPVSKYCQVTGSYYVEMEYTFEIRFQTWTKYILDSGFKEIDSQGKQKTILGDDQLPVQDQVPLDGNGSPLPQPIQPQDLVLLPFQMYRMVDFSTLNLDNVLSTGIGG